MRSLAAAPILAAALALAAAGTPVHGAEEVSDILMRAGDLEDVQVYGEDGGRIGEVETIVAEEAGRHFVVVSAGDVLGIGGEPFLVPIERFEVTTENLAVIENATKEQLEAMAEWSEDMPGYAVLDPQDEIAMRRAE